MCVTRMKIKMNVREMKQIVMFYFMHSFIVFVNEYNKEKIHSFPLHYNCNSV